MALNPPRIPLNVQFPSISKAKEGNPSWESFTEHEVFTPQYKEMENRPVTHSLSLMRRNPDGTLDFNWTKNAVIDAVHGLAYTSSILPIQRALLTAVLGDRYPIMEPQQANIMTQLSATEKKLLKEMVEAHFKEEANWSAGMGGGSVEGRHVTRSE